MPDAAVLATILLIVGLFLVALELMIPSFGMIGIMAAITLLISAWCAWQAWWGTSPGFFWTYAAFWVLGIPSALGGALFLLQNTSLGDRIVLRGPQQDENPGLAVEQQRLETFIGKRGTTTSPLTPGGMVIVDNNRFHAESKGMLVDRDAPVQVIAVKGTRLVVQPISNTAESTSASSEARSELADTVTTAALKQEDRATSDSPNPSDILDFEIPDN